MFNIYPKFNVKIYLCKFFIKGNIKLLSYDFYCILNIKYYEFNELIRFFFNIKT